VAEAQLAVAQLKEHLAVERLKTLDLPAVPARRDRDLN
jgi:hypothetical protein